MNNIGCNSMVDPLRRLIMKSPISAWKDKYNVKKIGRIYILAQNQILIKQYFNITTSSP